MRRFLARAVSVDGLLVGGTRDELVIGELRIPWEQVQQADWDRDEEALVVSEVGAWGSERPVHVVRLEKPGRLLELVRERVTASVVLQRHVPVHGRTGVFVIGRRAPRGDGPISWIVEYQEGVDPADPAVSAAATEALRRAREEVGAD